MKVFAAFIGFLLVGIVVGAPLQQDRVEEDPELTAGYYQGDMVLQKNRNGLKNESLHWPNNIVYYRFHLEHFDQPHLNHVLRGMRIIESVSCIRFYEAAPEQKYFVNITSMDGGCYSEVGWLNEVQAYNLKRYPLDEGCFRLGTIVHEFLHTLGFFHMQSASNRDEYVRIATENIQEGMEHNFEKYEKDFIDDYGIEYDYGSVLHYPSTAFSKNGELTIIPLKEEQAAGKMGQRRAMAQSDIDKLNLMYRCPVKA